MELRRARTRPLLILVHNFLILILISIPTLISISTISKNWQRKFPTYSPFKAKWENGECHTYESTLNYDTKVRSPNHSCHNEYIQLLKYCCMMLYVVYSYKRIKHKSKLAIQHLHVLSICMCWSEVDSCVVSCAYEFMLSKTFDLLLSFN